MKQFSVSELKRGRFSPQTRMEPRPGSKRRVLWDKLFATPGAPVELTPDESAETRQLSLWYNLDIRRIKSGNSRTRRISLYVLAGEWIGNGYVDYVAAAVENAA